ncbi:OsmC family protein [Deinococcus deserti]|uniref:Putative OsmC-like protein (Osmotically-inducible protein C-like protein) n=1 Tax=Deinococcus deserti (strain DSM 17065 / CIP 109153 / LMG 22923 / VCD115) TaxID=546414 RepID=C1CYW1_DEIDV|nr:OsmC family protein [Deinococcus deserti]ACO47141.1 putative OsmC-like protein (Osmotically-inducible protein C-like protein) [Deinococcus deserti VCD115]
MQIEVQVRQISPATSQATARTHQVMIDRPLEKGGEDRGMMGGEQLLVSLGGCFISNLLAAIKAREADITDVQLTVTGTLESSPSRFSAIEVVVDAQAQDRALLEKLVEMSDRACIVSNTLRPAVALSFRLA